MSNAKPTPIFGIKTRWSNSRKKSDLTLGALFVAIPNKKTHLLMR